MHGASDPQREAVYRAQSRAIASVMDRRDLWTMDDATHFVDSVTADLGVESIGIEFVDRPNRSQPMTESRVDVDRRVIHMEAPGANGATYRLLAIHEVAHVVAPSFDEPHGPAFVRTFLDLVDRFVPAHSMELRMQFLRRGVLAAPEPSPWRRPWAWLDMGELESIERGDDNARFMAALEDHIEGALSRA
jgi:hypothetical protein